MHFFLYEIFSGHLQIYNMTFCFLTRCEHSHVVCMSPNLNGANSIQVEHQGSEG